MYLIRPYHQFQAKQLGVEIEPSSKSNYKLDVYKNGQYVTSVGDKRYKDFILYAQDDLELAQKRRELYHRRHAKTSQVIGSRSYYAKHLLW